MLLLDEGYNTKKAFCFFCNFCLFCFPIFRFDKSPVMRGREGATGRPLGFSAESSSQCQGEEPRYVVKWDSLGYCRVAYLPNLDATGSILIISGTDLSSSDAGAEFITSERWVRHLRSALAVPDSKTH
jgi:hypothetical protein